MKQRGIWYESQLISSMLHPPVLVSMVFISDFWKGGDGSVKKQASVNMITYTHLMKKMSRKKVKTRILRIWKSFDTQRMESKVQSKK